MSRHRRPGLWILGAALALSPVALADDFPADGASSQPAREHDLLAIIGDAQKQFKGNRSTTAAQDARMAMQINVISFMRQSQAVQDWVGIVKSRGITPDGNAWISIDIGDGAIMSTWQNERDDANWATMFRPHSPLFGAAKGAQIGQRVTFSGTVLKSALAADDEMVNQPQFIVRFSALKIAQ